MNGNMVQLQPKKRHLSLALLAAFTFGIIGNTVEAFHIPEFSNHGSLGSYMGSSTFGGLYPGLNKGGKQSRFGQAVGESSNALNEDIPEDDDVLSADGPNEDLDDVTRDAYEPETRSHHVMRGGEDEEEEEQGDETAREDMYGNFNGMNDRYNNGRDFQERRNPVNYEFDSYGSSGSADADADDDDEDEEQYKSSRYDDDNRSSGMDEAYYDDYQAPRESDRRGYGSKISRGRFDQQDERYNEDAHYNSFLQADEAEDEDVTKLNELEQEIEATERELEKAEAPVVPEKPMTWYEKIANRYTKTIEKVQNFFSLKRRMDIAKRLQQLGERLNNYVNAKWQKIKSIFRKNADDANEVLFGTFTDDDWLNEMETVTDLPRVENETSEEHAVRLKDRILRIYRNTKNYFKKGLEVLAHKYLEMRQQDLNREAEQNNNLRARALPLEVAEPLIKADSRMDNYTGADADTSDHGNENVNVERKVAEVPSSFYEVGMRLPKYTIVGNGAIVEQGSQAIKNKGNSDEDDVYYDGGMITVSKDDADAKARVKLITRGILHPSRRELNDVEIKEVASEGAADANWGEVADEGVNVEA